MIIDENGKHRISLTYGLIESGYDALLYLLTFYTSTPEEVAQGVMDMIYGDVLYEP